MGSQGDNPHKVLALGENEGLGTVHWLPDGQRLAYIRARRTPEYSIETCDLKGTNGTVVVSDPELWRRTFAAFRRDGLSIRGRKLLYRVTKISGKLALTPYGRTDRQTETHYPVGWICPLGVELQCRWKAFGAPEEDISAAGLPGRTGGRGGAHEPPSAADQ